MPASDAPPAADPSSLSEVDRRALIRFLEQSLDHGFRLAIIEAATHTDREAILFELAPTIGPGLLRVALDELAGADTNVWSALGATFSAHQPRCLALWGIESRSRSDWPRQLNIQRELFVRDLAVPWLLFIHPAMRVPLLQTAPDFCDFAILWLRADRPVNEMDLSAAVQMRDVPSYPGDIVSREPLLQRARASLDAGRFDEARDLLARFDLQSPPDSLDQIDHQLLVARLESEQGHLGLAEALLRGARNALARHPEPAAEDLSLRIDAQLGDVLRLAGRYGEAEALLRHSLRHAEKVYGRQHLAYSTALHGLAAAVRHQGKYREAERLLRHALAIKEILLGREHRSYTASAHELATVLTESGDYSGAERVLREVLVIEESMLGARSILSNASIHELASVLLQKGNYPEAENLLRESLAVTEETFGREHPSYASSLHELARLLVRKGDYTESERLFREVLSIDERTLGRAHPSYAASLNELASVLLSTGKHNESEQLAREALALNAQTLGPEHPSYGVSLSTLGSVLTKQGDYSEAERLFRESLSIEEKTLGPEHPALCHTLTNLAVVAANQGRAHEAIPLLERALRIAHATLDPDHPDIRTIQTLLQRLKPG